MIRAAEQKDLKQIVEIYNWAVENTTATFDLSPKTIEEQQSWFANFNERFPLYIVIQNEMVKGWVSLSPWSQKKAYDSTAQLTIYIHPEHQGQGHGKQLLQHMIEHGKEHCFRTIISQISCEAEASFHLHRKFGFKESGVLKKVGKKFGRVLDVHIFQLFLDDYSNET